MRTIAVVVAAMMGATLAAVPALDAGGPSLLWLSRALHVLSTNDNTPEVALVLLDPESLRHPQFEQVPQAYWSSPLAQVLEVLLDAGVTIVGIDLILPRDDTLAAEWLQVLRRGARDGRIILGAAGGTLPALPSPLQRAALGTPSLGWVNLPVDRRGTVSIIPHEETFAALLAQRAGASVTGPIALAAIPAQDFVTWSAVDVIQHGLSPSVINAFSGRIVLIGAWLPDQDRHRGPHGVTAGVELHALAVHGWMQGIMVHPISLSAQTAVYAAVAALTLLLVFVGLKLMLATLPLFVIAAALLALHFGWATPWLGSMLAIGATVATTATAERLRTAGQLIERLPDRFRNDPRRGTLESITVCFIDIAAFTSVSEHCPPDHLAADLSRCLTSIEQVVEAHDGFVDKYLGDGVMALFGVGTPDIGGRSALAAANDCLALSGLTLAGQPVRLRIGLASGMARVGALGNTRRLHFTAIGDVVNVAARLEQLTRELGASLLADEGVAAATPDAGWHDCGLRHLRGREGPVRVWTLGTPV